MFETVCHWYSTLVALGCFGCTWTTSNIRNKSAAVILVIVFFFFFLFLNHVPDCLIEHLFPSSTAVCRTFPLSLSKHLLFLGLKKHHYRLWNALQKLVKAQMTRLRFVG